MERRWQRTEDTSVAEVVPGIWRLPVPLPGHSVGHVNVYALLSAKGTVLIDSGWGTSGCWRDLDGMLRGIGSCVDEVRLVLVTHFHPDHCGLAGAFARRTGVRIGMHPADAAHLDSRFFHPADLKAETVRWLTAAGAPPDAIESGLQSVERGAGRVQPVEPDWLIADGEVVDHAGWELQAIHTPGHTPGHLCFYERTTRTMFSGDHVLPHINTSPGYRPHCSPDPVGDYLRSFPRLAVLDVEWVLPGHQRPFTGLRERLDRLREHHRTRLSMTLQLLTEGGATAWEVTSRVSRSRAWTEFRNAARISALGETFGHLVHLVARGRARCAATAPFRFEAAD